MSKYLVGQLVEVTVERIFSFGVFVRLPDGTDAYIRRRELDIDTDLDPSQITHLGDKIIAKIIRPSEENKLSELSIRQTQPDPWAQFAKQYHEGDLVYGVVQSLHPNGAFVRIARGISGFVALGEMANWQIYKPEDILWVGDTTETVITHLDVKRRKLALSIKARLDEQSRALEIYREMVDWTAKENTKITLNPNDVLRSDELLDPALIDGMDPILIVDDEPEIRQSLSSWLSNRGFDVDQANSVESSIAALNKKSYRVVLVDINLGSQNGLEIIRFLQRTTYHTNMWVMSSPDSLLEKSSEIEALGSVLIFPKPLDIYEIERFLIQIAQDQDKPVEKDWPGSKAKSTSDNTSYFQELVTIQREENSPQQRLNSALYKTTELLHAQVGVIFELDSQSSNISILARAGENKLSIEAIYELDKSPVQDVIAEGETILANKMNEKNRARFDKLLSLLPFESCIALPIRMQDEIHHAAFFFHAKAYAFPHSILRDAQVATIFFETLLFEKLLHQRLQSISPILLHGVLATAFGHEISNKISALEILQRNIEPTRASPTDIEALFNLTLDLKKTVETFQHLLHTKIDKSVIQINNVIKQAEILLQPIARKGNVRIALKLAPDLPYLIGNDIALQQAILNVMLNALQQMETKPAARRILEISTSWTNGNLPINIRITDSGPGIHHKLWNKIFTPGFSTRGSSGLGLFISQSFVQASGGLIKVEKSLVPYGTTFLIELPSEG